MNQYEVKTRNWNGKEWVRKLLDWAGVNQTENYGDNDVKYWYFTPNAGVAWGLWLYFMILRPFSGGWTYIVRPGKQLGAGYKSVY